MASSPVPLSAAAFAASRSARPAACTLAANRSRQTAAKIDLARVGRQGLMRSVFCNDRSAEMIVQADARDAVGKSRVEQVGEVRRNGRTLYGRHGRVGGGAAADVAEIHVKIFELDRPVVAERRFYACADRPADAGTRPSADIERQGP